MTKKYYLVRYTEDCVTHICSSSGVRYQNINGKMIPFGKFSDNNYYKCKIILESTNFSYALEKLKDCKRRLGDLIELERLRDSTENYFLVQFVVTEDYYVCPHTLLFDDDRTPLTGIVNINNGAKKKPLRAQIIAKGRRSDLLRRLSQITKYSMLSTPEKKRIRNPLIPSTPRVVLQRLANTNKRNLLRDMQVDEHLGALINEHPANMEEESNSDQDDPEPFVPSDSDLINEHSANMEEERNSDQDDPEPFVLSDSDLINEHPANMEEESNSNQDDPEPFVPSDSDLINEHPANMEEERNSDQDDPEPFVPSDSDLSYVPSPSNSCSSMDEPDIESILEALPACSTTGTATYYHNEQLINTIVVPEAVPICIPTVPSALMHNEHYEQVIQETASKRPIDLNVEDNHVPQRKKSKRNLHSCELCRKLVTRIRRHFTTVHRNHPAVQTIMAMSDGKEKEDCWTQLRLKGTYSHNCNVLVTGKGIFLTQRQSNPGDSEKNYLPCEFCKGFFKASSLYKHVKKCNLDHKKYSRVQSSSILSLPSAVLNVQYHGPGMDVLKKKVLPKMKPDGISKAVRMDPLILKWGAWYCGKNLQRKQKAHLTRVASQRMRMLGRLLVVLHKLYGEECYLSNFIKPEKFDDLVEAVRDVSGDHDGEFNVPSLPLAIGYLVEDCAVILRSENAKIKNKNQMKDAAEFLNLYKHHWPELFSSRALDQLKEKKFEKRHLKLLPLADDILTLTNYLKIEQNQLTANLQKGFNHIAWVNLSKILLVSIIIYNRKRVGDVQRITLKCYNRRTVIDRDSDIYKALSPAEKLSASQYAHLFTTGKKGRIVPTMIPLSLIRSFELLLNYRLSAGVSETNEYLFAKANSDCLYYDGCEAMRIITKKSGAKQHLSLRSTSLRKHIATMSQVMNLDHCDLDILAGYMGHSIHVHRDFYRLPDEAIHLARISRLLSAVSSNNISSMKGKSLDELPVPDTTTSLTDYLISVDNEASDDDDTGQNEDNDNKSIEDNHQEEIPAVILRSKATKGPVPWTQIEKDAVLKHLSNCVIEKRSPRKTEVEKCLAAEKDTLGHRTWRNVKDFIRNYCVTLIRRTKKSSIA